MERPPDERTKDVEDLSRLVHELERRVSALEMGRQSGPLPLSEPLWPRQAIAAGPRGSALPALPGNIFPVLGRALLGIAGAYLLRAAAESGALPQMAAVLAAVIYAGWWLVSSSRVINGSRFTIAVYGLTAALVLAPMLWETTVRFQVLPARITAVVLVLFVVLGAALAWTRNLAAIAWIATLAGVATAMTLIVATHEVVPFTAALLAIALNIEYAACGDRWLSERWLVALTADFAVFLLTYLVTRPNGVPEGYPAISGPLAIAFQIALLAVYLGSTVYRTLIHGLNITFFEMGQAVLALLISIGGALEVSRRALAANTAAGMFSIAAGAACYFVAFRFVESERGRRRNFYAYGSFGLALALAGCYILFSGPVLAITLSALAAAAMTIGERAGRTTLRMHSAAYLLGAAIASGLFGFGYDRLIGSAARWAAPVPEVLITGVAAAVCYLLVRGGAGRVDRIPAAIAGAVLCWSAIGLSIGMIGPLYGATLATVRTAILCAVAIVLGWAGRRWNRPELVWLLYPLMALGAFKLVVEDFRQGRAAAMSLSLVCYGAALILLPRLVRKRKTLRVESAAQVLGKERGTTAGT